jgi:hypothetical protein
MLKTVVVVVAVILMSWIGGLLLGLMLAPLFPKGLPTPIALLLVVVALGILIWWGAGFRETKP